MQMQLAVLVNPHPYKMHGGESGKLGCLASVSFSPPPYKMAAHDLHSSLPAETGGKNRVEYVETIV